MAYKVYLNSTDLIFDSTLQSESFAFSTAFIRIQAGAAGSFDFIMPPTHKYYDTLHRLTDYIDVYRNDVCIFSGRVYSITTQFDLQQEISCEGLLAVLNDSICRPWTYQGTLHDLFAEIVDKHNRHSDGLRQIEVGNITVDDANVYRGYKLYETSIVRLKDLVKTFGGYLMIRKGTTSMEPSIVDIGIVDTGYTDVGSSTVIYLDWLKEFTTECAQQIELKENLIDLQKIRDSQDLVTILLPLGATDDDGEKITIKSVNNGDDFIAGPVADTLANGLVTITKTWDAVTKPSTLKTKAQAYLNELLNPKVTVKLSAVDLADCGYDIESFRVGQVITVVSAPHGIDATRFSCISQDLDLLNPALNRIELERVVE